MTIQEVAKLFNIKEQNKEMRNKEKANEIMAKILKCNKCGHYMRWIEGTNICVCDECTYTYKSGKDGKTSVTSRSRMIQEKNRKFLENNYHNFKPKSEV